MRFGEIQSRVMRENMILIEIILYVPIFDYATEKWLDFIKPRGRVQ